MIRKGFLLIVSLAPILASVSARADVCFQYDSGGGILAAKGAKVPAQDGVCATVALAEQGSPSSRAGAAAGSICKSNQFDPSGIHPTLGTFEFRVCLTVTVLTDFELVRHRGPARRYLAASLHPGDPAQRSSQPFVMYII